MSHALPCYSFAGGPTKLPREVLQLLEADLLKSGDSIGELYFASKEVKMVRDQLFQLLRKQCEVPQNYAVDLTAGGAQLHFGAIPLNLGLGSPVVNYAETGYFSKKSIDQAAKNFRVHSFVKLEKDQHGRMMVPHDKYHFDKEAKLIHYVDNQSVEGIQYQQPPTCEGMLVSNDCSSNFLTKPIEWDKTDLVYAHAQKNCGTSGGTFLIVKKQAIRLEKGKLPCSLDYSSYLTGESTLPSAGPFALYSSLLFLKFIRSRGDSRWWQSHHRGRSNKLYKVIDDSRGFYKAMATPSQRSRITVTWDMNEPLKSKLIEEAPSQGVYDIKGHRAIGGFRASLFNGVQDQAVDTLRDLMLQFQAKHQ